MDKFIKNIFMTGIILILCFSIFSFFSQRLDLNGAMNDLKESNTKLKDAIDLLKYSKGQIDSLRDEFKSFKRYSDSTRIQLDSLEAVQFSTHAKYKKRASEILEKIKTHVEGLSPNSMQ